MAYVVTEPCIGTKDRACVEVCPVDCFYDHKDESLNNRAGKAAVKEGDFGMLLINPDECIHCGACEPECPVKAIFEDDSVPEEYRGFIELNEKVCSGFSEADAAANRVTFKE
jgi:NAD-dependent dihydropyrimidine dehydrogenase PreA subunit